MQQKSVIKLFLLSSLAFIGAGCFSTTTIHTETINTDTSTDTSITGTSSRNTPPAIGNTTISFDDEKNPPLSVSPSTASKDVIAPMERAGERVTKKPFGKYVTPKNSPVSPEVFTGYHTGVDFEVFENEQNVEIAVSAICTGTVREKRWVTGYGGVLIQNCRIDQQIITVLYGHLKIDSIPHIIGQELKQGERIGILGKGYTQETSNERKHLHLSIHRGTNINLKGYVQSKSELNGWIDAVQYLAK